MLNRVLTAAAIVATAASVAVARPDLNVGDPAPTLSNVTWLQGDQASEWKSGNVYVLDFWATWCGPCVASIPHINDLHKDFKSQNVKVIGVAIWPKDGMVPTDTFLKNRDDMTYVIAADVDGKTAKAFMEAAGQNGIPTAMVVGKTGKIEWIGHPMDGLEDVVEEIVHDRFDAVAFANKANVERDAVMAIYPRMMEAREAQNWAGVVAAADELIAINPKKFSGINMVKYHALVMGDDASAKAFGERLVSETIADDSNALNGFAWLIVAPDSEFPASKQDAALALKAAKKASALTKDKDWSILDTLARAHFVAGDAKSAVATQKLAIENAPEGAREELKASLAEYETSVKSM